MIYSVTVIIRTRNRQDLVINAIESVYNQTIRSSIQCLVINDASTDDTVEIINSWVSSHSDFRLDLINLSVNVKNGGALIEAKKYILGHYVIILDDDDKYIRADALELLYNQCIQGNLDVLYPSSHNGVNAPHWLLMFRSDLFKVCPISRIHYTEDHYTHWFSRNTSLNSGFHSLGYFLRVKPSDTDYRISDYYEDFSLHRIFEDLYYNYSLTPDDIKALQDRFHRIDKSKLSDHMKPTWDEVDSELSKLSMLVQWI